MNAAKNTANKNSKKKRKMQPVPSKVASRVTAPSKTFNRLQNTTRNRNVTVSGQPPAPPAPSSSIMCTEVTESADGQPPPQSSSTMCAQSAGGQPPPQSSQSAGGQPPPQSSSTMCTQSAAQSTACKTLAFEDWNFPSDKS